MKHFTLIGMAALLSVSVQAQVFTSGVEDWTDELPDDFMGTKTTIADAAVFQVSTNVHGGMYAVRLENPAPETHKRFTTQPLSVANAQGYEVSFWARGEGEVRVGLYDGRATGSGYAPYSSYEDLTSTWQEFTFTVVAAMDADDAEFIISVINTVAPEHVTIDDVNVEEVTVTPPVEATIVEIQTSTGPDWNSAYVDQVVTTTGRVSALTGTSGYFLQDGTGPWSGIYVFSAPGALVRGDEVTITGTIVEFNGQTQFTSVSNAVVASSGNTVASTPISTLDGNTEPYESVLVKVTNADCLSSGPFGQFTVSDGSGNVLVDDVIYAYPFVVGTSYDITGVLQYAFSEWRILPRENADVSVATSISELAGATVTLFPNPANNVLTLDLGTLSGRTEYALTDATGRVVLADVATAIRSTIDVSGLSNGLYVVTLRNGDAVMSTRVQVQR